MYRIEQVKNGLPYLGTAQTHTNHDSTYLTDPIKKSQSKKYLLNEL